MMWPPAVDELLSLAIEEDFGRGDATSEALLEPTTQAKGVIVAKEPLVLSGVDVAEAAFRRFDPAVELTLHAKAATAVKPGTAVLSVAGPAVALLAGERIALNFLQRLSGVATLTSRYVAAVEGTKARIVDTRKTTPGWRWLEKRAVRHGGGANHRADLGGGILIKDNHLTLLGVGEAVRRARSRAAHSLRIEVEVTSLEQLDEALAAGADLVLLDNFSPERAAEAVERTAGRALLEISGGVTLETVRTYALLGVDLISIGRLTHSAPAVDLSLELDVGSS